MSILIYLLFELFYNDEMKITEHFDSKEFDCHDGTPYPPEWIETRLKPLCEALEALRAVCGPIHINSGYRTPAYNKKIGGALFSQHCQGRAADISCNGFTPFNIQLKLTELIHNKVIPDGGVGLYKSWVHYDLGPRRRWHG